MSPTYPLGKARGLGRVHTGVISRHNVWYCLACGEASDHYESMAPRLVMREPACYCPGGTGSFKHDIEHTTTKRGYQTWECLKCRRIDDALPDWPDDCPGFWSASGWPAAWEKYLEWEMRPNKPKGKFADKLLVDEFSGAHRLKVGPQKATDTLRDARRQAIMLSCKHDTFIDVTSLSDSVRKFSCATCGMLQETDEKVGKITLPPSPIIQLPLDSIISAPAVTELKVLNEQSTANAFTSAGINFKTLTQMLDDAIAASKKPPLVTEPAKAVKVGGVKRPKKKAPDPPPVVALEEPGRRKRTLWW